MDDTTTAATPTIQLFNKTVAILKIPDSCSTPHFTFCKMCNIVRCCCCDAVLCIAPAEIPNKSPTRRRCIRFGILFSSNSGTISQFHSLLSEFVSLAAAAAAGPLFAVPMNHNFNYFNSFLVPKNLNFPPEKPLRGVVYPPPPIIRPINGHHLDTHPPPLYAILFPPGRGEPAPSQKPTTTGSRHISKENSLTIMMIMCM